LGRFRTLVERSDNGLGLGDAMSANVFRISPQEWETFRQKLTYKVRFHLGSFCPDIEDLVQETLVRFHRALVQENLRRFESMGSFLNAICNNVISEYRRRLWREVPYETEIPPERPVRPVTDILEMRDSIDAALEQLNDRDRAILIDFYLKEQEKEDICQRMGVSDAQFRVIISRAKERMRRILAGGAATGA
jgi:RNA polymerase sigma-70 factor (ECF subfamily)